MLRKLIIAAFSLAIPIAATAATDIPSEVNLHNGYVVVRDTRPSSSGYIKVYEYQHASTMGFLRSRSGDVTIANKCCILAGTENRVQVDEDPRYGGKPGWSVTLHFVPRLCNVRGIPFGYADIVITEYLGKIYLHRVDEKCPE